MTTRAGLVGLGLGALLNAVLFRLFYLTTPRALDLIDLALILLALALTIGGGGVAARWARAESIGQRLTLGALAGGLGAALLFCGLGAAAAGISGAYFTPQPIQLIPTTLSVFWTHLLTGVALGALGGWWLGPRVPASPSLFHDLTQPQMALNTVITAVPAAAVAVLIAAAEFGRLSPEAAVWPIVTALWLHLLGLVGLAWVVPHEARAATHRAGVDEVKMAAWVGLFTPPALLIGLGLIDWRLLLTPQVSSSLLVSLGLSLYQGYLLRTLILPRRAQMPPPANQLQAVFFGTIARSRWQTLVPLCFGCGLVMFLPLYVTVIAPLINLALIASGPPSLGARLYQAQAGVSFSLLGGAGMVLTALYLFYASLGRFVAGWGRSRPTRP